MATQRRSPKSTAKKSAKSTTVTRRKRVTLKATAEPRKRSMTAASRPLSAAAKRGESSVSMRASTVARTARRSGGAIKRAIKKGISELAKVGS